MHVPIQMQALVKHERGVALEFLPVPELEADDQAIVRVAYAGICRTDLYVASGKRPSRTPVILGHELAGRVLQAGAASPYQAGTTVSVRPEMPCNVCRTCKRGHDCEDPVMLGIERDGAFAEFLRVPASQLVPLPEDLPLIRGALVEPVAAALSVVNRPLLGRGVIVGKNRVSVLLQRVLATYGLPLDAIDIPANEAARIELRNTFDYVIEAQANSESLAFCTEILRPHGQLLLKSRPYGNVEINVAALVRKEIAIQACNYGSFGEAASLLLRLPIEDLLEVPVRLQDFRDAFGQAQTGAKKVIFRIGDTETCAEF